MDIAALSINMNQRNVRNDVDIALMKMVMNNGEKNQIIKTQENNAVDLNLGQHLDVQI